MFENVMNQLRDAFGGFLPELLTALLVLVVGWILALVVAAVVRALLRKTTLDNRIAGWVRGEQEEGKVPVEKTIGRVVFWLLMILVLVAFFEVLGLSQVSRPLDDFLAELAVYMPRILGAGVLLVLAWVVASALRFLVRRTLDTVGFDKKLARRLEDDEQGAEEARDRPSAPTLSRTISETVYWLVFLLFLPAVLGALELTGLLGPVNTLTQELLAFLPDLLGAALILLVGWLVARIVRNVVVNLLQAAGTDRLAARVGVEKVLAGQRLSGVIGTIVYVLILIPVVIAALNALALRSVTEPASNMLESLLMALPQLFGAALVLVIAYVVGRLLASLVTSLLATIGFDALVDRMGLRPAGTEATRAPSALVGYGVLVAVLLFASIEAASMLSFELLAQMLTELTLFLANVLLGLLVLVLGIYLGNLAAKAIRSSGLQQAPLLATLAHAAVVVLAGAMALRQIGVAQDIVNLAFGLLLGAAAVAAAIAFGIGGRGLAAQHLERWVGAIDERGKRSSGGPGAE